MVGQALSDRQIERLSYKLYEARPRTKINQPIRPHLHPLSKCALNKPERVEIRIVFDIAHQLGHLRHVNLHEPMQELGLLGQQLVPDGARRLGDLVLIAGARRSIRVFGRRRRLLR